VRDEPSAPRAASRAGSVTITWEDTSSRTSTALPSTAAPVGEPAPKLHDLRNAYATALLAAGLTATPSRSSWGTRRRPW
jgi:hypothetical protein